MKTFKKCLALLLCLALLAVGTVSSLSVTAEEAAENLALGKETFTDSGKQQKPAGLAVDGIDGQDSSRWAGVNTKSTDPGDWWIAVKLGDEPVAFNRVVLSWENCYGKDYVIETADDLDGPWTKVSEEHLNAGGKKRVTVDTRGAKGKYMRVHIFEKATTWGVSLYEIEVYHISRENFNLALGRPAGDNLNGTNQNGYFANKMVDGDEGSRWTGTQDKTTTGQWAPWVKLGVNEPVRFDTIKILWEVCYGKKFAVQITDGDPAVEENWQTVGNYTNGSKDWQTITLPASRSAMYLRLFITEKANASYGVGIWELQVYDFSPDSENHASGAATIWDPTNLSAFCGDLNVNTLTDGFYGNTGNCWQPNAAMGAVVFLKFAEPTDLNKVILLTENKNERYEITYTTAALSDDETFASMQDHAWIAPTNAVCEYALEKFSNNDTAYTYYSMEPVEGATAIRLKCTQTNGGWTKIREAEVYNDTTDTNNSLTSAKQYRSDETNEVLVLTNVSKQQLENKTLRAIYTVKKNDGRTIRGQIDVENAFAMVVLGGQQLTAGDILGGHKGDYVAALRFTNMEPGASVSVSFTILD